MITRRSFLRVVAAYGALAAPFGRASLVGTVGPAEVLVIRHGEEPKHGPHLSDRGRKRAAALVTLFEKRFVRPTALFAARSSRASERAAETLEPLAAALGLRLDQSFGPRHCGDLASAILTGPPYAGGHVLICWHHDTIRALASALGVARPPSWPATQYDHVWRMRFVADRANLSDEPQRLLPGDDA